ncbi:TetR/AcrR family transcriptional regulator [Pedobacter nototheniae]|uniref:TetR/AcrR family transcriptional regulator n=1 Tax=Pedobacter nototheniae TaxID=2488994 RepID=UPI00292FD0D2|nr:TetR/AcrR family transcriptional regulator [Pedobacter nototheniae]
MGIKERKEKHKEDLRQRILDAAKELFLREGYDATSIRKIAEKIEFSPTTIYLYYKDKTDIMYALHQEGFKLLGTQFMVLQHVYEPFERLKAMGRVYMSFALNNPDFYELMFIQKEPIEFVKNHCADEEWEEGEQSFAALIKTVEDCQHAGYFTGFEANTFALNVWSLMHGLCSLKLQGHLDHVASAKLPVLEGNNIMDQTFDGFIKILQGLK